MEEIDLCNNYCILNKKPDLPTIEISHLSFGNIIKKNRLILNIDFNTLKYENYKKILRKTLRIKSIYQLMNLEIGYKESDKIVIGYIQNYQRENKRHQEFIQAINAIYQKSRYERYNYIYDTVCDYLDSYFYGKNLCDFKDNKCGEKRNTSSTTGCCHHFRVKWLGPFTKLVPCEYLSEDHTCSAKCISCKLFTCDYLEKKGIKFKIKDILLLDTFFNPIQKYFIKYMVFTPKEKILNRLLVL